jgi:hypothetical protein
VRACVKASAPCQCPIRATAPMSRGGTHLSPKAITRLSLVNPNPSPSGHCEPVPGPQRPAIESVIFDGADPVVSAVERSRQRMEPLALHCASASSLPGRLLRKHPHHSLWRNSLQPVENAQSKTRSRQRFPGHRNGFLFCMEPHHGTPALKAVPRSVMSLALRSSRDKVPSR